MATGFDSTSLQNIEEEELSGLLCDLMFYHTGADSKSTEIYKNITLIQDFLCNLRFKWKMCKHSVGSKGEGTSIEESDSDDLCLWGEIVLCQNDVHEAFIWKKVMVCESDEQVDEPNSVVFILDRKDCQPGYTKLKLVKNEMITRALRNKGKTMIEKTEQGYYLSNRKVIEFFAEILRQTKIPLNVYKHGPCATAVMANKYYKNESLSDLDRDHAQGFPISNMTKEGRRWLEMMDESTAERDWPSSKTINKIRALKCEVVAVGSHDSDFSLEWRISYTLWERELIWSFQDVQFHCYGFLKRLLQRRLKKISDDITPFQLKNIVFWESVDCSVEILQSKTNYLLMVKKCLIRLRDAIYNQRLIHFIDRNRNLFESKLTEEDERLKLIKYLDEELIRSHKIIPVAFDCINRDDLNKLWIRFECDHEPAEFLNKRKFCDKLARKLNISEKFRKFIERYGYGNIILGITNEILLDISDEMLDLYVKNLDEIHKIDVDYDYLEITEKILKFYHKLMSSAKRLCTNMEVNDFIRNRQALYTDVLADRLYLCTSLIRCDRFIEAKRIIDDFLNSDSKRFVYCGRFSDCKGIAVAGRKVTFEKFPCLDVTDDPFPLVFDITVHNANIDFFPPAIQLQLSLEIYLYLNPVVYMYYLKVVCDVNLNRNADHSLQSLNESVRGRDLKSYSFRHLNLLGHAYMLTKKYKDAYNCFLDSVKISRCDNLSKNVQNSVFYLLAVLIYQIQNTRKGDGST